MENKQFTTFGIKLQLVFIKQKSTQTFNKDNKNKLYNNYILTIKNFSKTCTMYYCTLNCVEKLLLKNIMNFKQYQYDKLNFLKQ